MPSYGALDIGSNSVRMQAAEVVAGGPVRILAEERQVTRLGDSVFRQGRISDETLKLTTDVLGRMARTFEKEGVENVRAVATSALRDARNQEEFLEQARGALGIGVEIISGQEESRLIHLGVESRWPHPTDDIFIFDIGGGSAELIQAHRGHLKAAFSKPLGAVRLTRAFLKDDPPTQRQLHQLDEYIEQKLRPVLRSFGSVRPRRTIATSATASSLVCAAHRVPRARRDLIDRIRISRAQLRRMYEDLSRRSLRERRLAPGIGPRRAEVIIAGCAVLCRVLEDFRLPSLYYSRAGVRDGLIADLAQGDTEARSSRLDEDRRRVVRDLALRYGVPLPHADQVASMAATLFVSLQPLHNLPESAGRYLEAAAYLHDIGHFVSGTRHHRHSFYLVANSDLAGFTARERMLVANLCRYHRKALPSPSQENFRALSDNDQQLVERLIPPLRLADSLDRSREQRVSDVRVRIRRSRVELQLVSSQEVDLEQWAAQQVDDAFRQVYNCSLIVLQNGA